MEPIHIDTLIIKQERHGKNKDKFFIVDNSRCGKSDKHDIFLLPNQQYSNASGDCSHLYYPTLDQAIETCTIFVKNKYHKPKYHYRVTLEISSDDYVNVPNGWDWKTMLGLNSAKDKVKVIACDKIE